MLDGIYLESVGGYDTDPFADQDAPMKVWIAGIVNEDKWDDDWPGWQFVGVFDSEEKAVAACKTNQYFVASYTVNEAAPEETRPMPGCYYPLTEKDMFFFRTPEELEEMYANMRRLGEERAAEEERKVGETTYYTTFSGSDAGLYWKLDGANERHYVPQEHLRIYQLQGDEFKVCVVTEGEDR